MTRLHATNKKTAAHSSNFANEAAQLNPQRNQQREQQALTQLKALAAQAGIKPSKLSVNLSMRQVDAPVPGYVLTVHRRVDSSQVGELHWPRWADEDVLACCDKLVPFLARKGLTALTEHTFAAPGALH